MKLQNRVRELRAKHRLSQGDLGKRLDHQGKRLV